MLRRNVGLLLSKWACRYPIDMESDENQQDPICMESSVFKSNIPFVHTYMYVIEPWFGDFLLSIYYLVVCNYKNRFSKTLLRNSLESVWCSKVDFVLLFVSQQTECKTNPPNCISALVTCVRMVVDELKKDWW